MVVIHFCQVATFFIKLSLVVGESGLKFVVVLVELVANGF